VQLLFLPTDTLLGTDPGANPAAVADLRVNEERDQVFAHPGRAFVVHNMGQILIPEISDGGQDRVGGGAAQGAQGKVPDGLG
jgi:hypothetical protein